jgi:hypothetical protein
MTHKELKIQVETNSGAPSADELGVNSPLGDLLFIHNYINRCGVEKEVI